MPIPSCCTCTRLWLKRSGGYLINAKSAIIDGEIVIPAADGTTDFSVLQNELKGTSTKIVMVAFDLMYLNGQDVRKLPLLKRKALLQKLIAKTAIRFSESLKSTGARCSSTPARPAWKAWFQKCGICAQSSAPSCAVGRNVVPCASDTCIKWRTKFSTPPNDLAASTSSA
jgi:ATP dependent DNA ligase domain